MSVVASFVYEVPFTVSGPTYGDVHEQQKRKVIKMVSHPFPFLLRRQKVTQSKEVRVRPLCGSETDGDCRSLLRRVAVAGGCGLLLWLVADDCLWAWWECRRS